MIVVFSKDRAFQLEACLRTLLMQCRDVAGVPVRVLWTASSPRHRQAYDLLRASYKASTHIEFIEESNFRRDLTLVLGNFSAGSWQASLAQWLLKNPDTSGKQEFAQAVIGLLSRPAPHMLFVVDDTLFLRPFDFAECSRILLANAEALAFSLRLGQGLTHFYMGDCAQAVPEMTAVDAAKQIYQFRWAEAKGDFEYPLEVSSSILKLDLILPRLLRKKWHSPNTLELALANMTGRYREKFPVLLTFPQPRAVSVPLNIVQKDFTDNRHGGQDRYHPDALCDCFLQGTRADLSQLERINPTSVHAEIDLLPAA